MEFQLWHNQFYKLSIMPCIVIFEDMELMGLNVDIAGRGMHIFAYICTHTHARARTPLSLSFFSCLFPFCMWNSAYPVNSCVEAQQCLPWLFQIQMDVDVRFVQDHLKGDNITEIRLKFIKRLEDAVPVGED